MKRSLRFLLIPAVPTLIYVGCLLFYPERDILILWRREAPPLDAVLPLLICAPAYGAAAWWLLGRVETRQVRRRWLGAALAGLAIVGGLAVQITVTRASEPDVLVALARRTYAWKSSGYWTAGAPVTDVARFIGDYPQHAPDYPVHPSRHPPGLSLIFWFGTRLFELAPGLAEAVAAPLRDQSCQSLLSTAAPAPQMAAGVFGAGVEIALAMLAVIPLYALVKRLAGPAAAAWAAVLYPLMPGFGMWVSQFDRGFTLITAVTLCLCEDIVTRNSARRAFLAGLVLSIGTFLSFGNVPIAGIAAVYSLVRVAQTTPALAASIRLRPPSRAAGAIARLLAPRLLQGGLALLGMAGAWAAAFAFFGLNPVELYRVIFASHLGIPFPYWPFVAWHPWDILTFIGLPLAAIAILAGWQRAGALSAALVVTLAALSLAHVARGETGRVWLFFAPLAVGAAAIVLAGRTRFEQGAVVGLLVVQLAAQGATMRVMNDIGYFPDTLPPASVPATATAIDTRFGASGQIALLAYEIGSLKPGGTATITLYWQRMSDAPIDTAYKAFIHIANDESDQARIAAGDSMPVYDLFPTTCWQQGTVVKDVRELAVSAEAKPGQYPIFVGLYDPVARQRAPAFASPPARELYGSLLLPERAVVAQGK